MANGVEFTGDGGEDASQGPASTGQPEAARRGSNGPIDFTGDGAECVGGTIDVTSERGSVPKGADIQFAGEGGEDA
jgi:hypothetical protein